MKFIYKENMGLPLQCDCCEQIIGHREIYSVFTYNDIEVSLKKECHMKFIREMKKLAKQL